MTAIQTGLHYPLKLDNLPTNWDVGYVGDFADDIEPGFASGEHNQEGTGVPHLRPMNIDRAGKIDLNLVKYVDPAKNVKRLRCGDVLFNNTNSPELIGKTTAITNQTDWAFSNHMTRIAFSDLVDPKFAAYQLHFLWMTGYFLHKCVKHVNQASVSSTPLEKTVPFIRPPLDQQKTIVAEIEKQFSRLDEAVANLKRVKANLKRYKAAVLKDAVEGKLTSSDKRRWQNRLLGDVIISIQAGKSFKCEEKPPHENEVGVVKVSAVTWGTYDELETKTCLDPSRIDQRLFVKPGDFLFSRANTIQLVGACVIAGAVNKHVMLSDKILRLRFTDAVLPEWVLYWLRAESGRGEIQRLSTGNQESMRNIGQDRIRQIRIEVPPLPDQKRIVAEMARRLSINEELTNEIDTNLKRVERLRQSILQRAFEGKLVNEISDTETDNLDSSVVHTISSTIL